MGVIQRKENITPTGEEQMISIYLKQLLEYQWRLYVNKVRVAALLSLPGFRINVGLITLNCTVYK